MLTVRNAKDRGLAFHGWLKSFHTFSFGHYRNPDEQGFSDLLVINDDRVIPARALVNTRTATWRFSPTCWKARWSTRTRWAPAR